MNMGSAAVWVGAAFLIGLVAGLIVGRWWALLLTALVPIAAIPMGEDSHGAPAWFWALILLAPFTLSGLATGVRARRARTQRGPRSAHQ